MEVARDIAARVVLRVQRGVSLGFFVGGGSWVQVAGGSTEGKQLMPRGLS